MKRASNSNKQGGIESIHQLKERADLKKKGFQRNMRYRASIFTWIVLLVLLFLGGCSPWKQMESNSGKDQSALEIPKSDSGKNGEKRWAREVHLQTEALLGTLQKQATSQEKEKLQRKVEEMQNLQEVASKTPKGSGEKEAKIQETNRYLDQLTKKYFPGWKKAEKAWNESYSGEIYDKKAMLEILETKLSSKDYKSLKKMYHQWLHEDTPSSLADELYDKMENILETYPHLDASFIMEDLADLSTETLGIFLRGENGSFSYQPGERRALPELSAEEQQKCRGYIQMMEQVLPPEAVAHFDTVTIFTDGWAGTYAYVNPLDEDAKRWNLSIDKEDMEHPEDFCYTAVHEYAHYLSLNHQQMIYPPKPSLNKVSGLIYHDDTFEARKDSYIQAYYEEFWTMIHDDRMANKDNILFYLRHHDEFINSYAATDCAEDFAETFAWFVLDDQVENEVVQRKIDFFKRYPQLEKEKQSILASMKQHHIHPEKYGPEYEDWKSIMTGGN